MASTAAVVCTPESVIAGRRFTATLTITSGNADAATTIKEATLTATPHSLAQRSTPAVKGVFALGPGQNNVVPGGSGTLVLTTQCALWAPISVNDANQIYDVGAIIYFADGSTVVATVDQVTVTAIVIG